MSLYLLIGILKFLGAAVTGVLGVYGLFGKYTKRNGGLTPNGKRMLVAIGLATAVALGASLAETFKAKSDADEQVARAERTFRDLSRALQPITQAKISYTPRNNPIVRSYVDYLIRELGPQLKPLQEHQFDAKFKRPEDTSILSEDLNGDPLTIDIGPKSLFWPKGNYAVLSNVVQAAVISIYIERTPIVPTNFNPIHGVFGLHDLTTMALPYPNQSRIQLNWFNKKLLLSASYEFDKNLWETSGRVVSLPDLEGAQIFFLLPYSSNWRLPERIQRQIDSFDHSNEVLIRHISVKSIHLEFSEGRGFGSAGRGCKRPRLRGVTPSSA